MMGETMYRKFRIDKLVLLILYVSQTFLLECTAMFTYSGFT